MRCSQNPDSSTPRTISNLSPPSRFVGSHNNRGGTQKISESILTSRCQGFKWNTFLSRGKRLFGCPLNYLNMKSVTAFHYFNRNWIILKTKLGWKSGGLKGGGWMSMVVKWLDWYLGGIVPIILTRWWWSEGNSKMMIFRMKRVFDGGRRFFHNFGDSRWPGLYIYTVSFIYKEGNGNLKFSL